MTTIGVQVSSDRVILVVNVVCSGVDTNLNPSKETIREIITQVNILREGIKGCACSDNVPHVIRVAGDSLSVCVVGVDFFNSLAKLRVPEELTDVGDVVCGRDGVVAETSDVHVRE